MSTTHSISATEFKAKCLEILDRLGNRQIDRLVITKRGKPVAILSPPETEASALRGLHGCLRGSAVISAGVDVTAPVIGEVFDAVSGRLHG